MPLLLDTVTHGWDDTLHEENLRRVAKGVRSVVKHVRRSCKNPLGHIEESDDEKCSNCMDDVLHGPPGIGLCSVIPHRLAFISISSYDVRALKESFSGCNVNIVSSDLHRQYVPLCDDFGPVNLGVVCRFYRAMVKRMEQATSSSSLIIYCIDPDFKSHANACFLLGSFLVLHCGKTPQEAAKPFTGAAVPTQPVPFRDASWVPSDFDLTLVDCLGGIARAMQLGWFDPASFEPPLIPLAPSRALRVPLREHRPGRPPAAGQPLC
jgi:hypothetical protein